VTINSIWLDGSNYADLSKVGNSELLISLPYGTHASKVLSKRLGVDFIELDVPFGLKNTTTFVQEI
jgi:nitrogenase molybdenum-iron protein alpha/beta subunit